MAKTPTSDRKLVQVFVRVYGETTRNDIDVQAFVGCVITAGRRHLGVREQVRIETSGPQAGAFAATTKEG
jgi:hypothetical protein